MKTPLQITFRDIEHSDAIEAHIREKAGKLETFFEPIMSCRVVVEMPHQHKNQGKAFNVRIDIGVPGSEIVVNRDKHEDVYVALRDAFDAARRQLEDYGRRLRRETKSHSQEYTGLVARILEEWEGVVGVVETVPGRGGIFDVHVDGELVFTKSMLGRYPEPDEVAPLLRERLERACARAVVRLLPFTASRASPVCASAPSLRVRE